MEGVEYQEIFYEGYGPGGSAVYVRALTDNRNRTVAEIRKLFTRNGGNLGESGCVSWVFEMKGRILIKGDSVSEDSLFETAIDSGAEDLIDEDNDLVVITSPENFEEVRSALKNAGFEYENAEVTMIPKTSIKVEGKEAEHMVRLMESLEDSDDVQGVYSNFDISEELLESLG